MPLKRLPEILELLKGDETLWAILRQDLPRWRKSLAASAGDADYAEAFEHVFARRQEFRSLVEYRLNGREIRKAYEVMCSPKPSWWLVQNLYLSTPDIGPGFYIEHGFSSIVFARSIGRNFHLNQNVTVGSGRGGIPTIGDDVSIRTGAVVFGNIRIGNRVRIGANAVVNMDVPDDSIVVSPRAAIVSRR